MVATTPKARLVKLAITRQGAEPFSIGDSSRKVTHYVVKVEIGGAAGLVAPLLGKQPPDIHVWILVGMLRSSLSQRARSSTVARSGALS